MKVLKSLSAASLLALTFVMTGCGDSEGPGTAPGQLAGPSGSIRGHVRLQGEAPRPASDTITQDQKVCGSSVSLPRIALGSDNAVEGAFVILEGVPDTGRAPLPPTTQSILIDQKDCVYVPNAMIVPLGSKVEISNSDPILHNVHGVQAKDGEMQNVFNYAQARQGQRETLDMSMTKPGMIFLSCEAGHPWMNAYVFVATDPFVALTDKKGEFVIKDVPPGTYTLKMWHEGVTLQKINKQLQTYQYEDPYEVTQQVTVMENGEAMVNFDLVLRK
jgi:hypothetical protein